MFHAGRRERGFSLNELMITVALASTLMAIAVPITRDLTATIRLNDATRLLEREFQDARLRAVSANRALRVRVNCPSAGFLRTVEVLGTAADTASNRCLQSSFPFPPDDNLMTRPNYDGPVRVFPHQSAVTTATLEFRPDGTVANVVSGVLQPILGEQVVTVTRGAQFRTVRINGAGKIRIQ